MTAASQWQALGEAQQRAERYPALQSAIDGVRSKAVSIRRDLSVEVDAAGVLRGLRIGDSALDRGGDRLAAEIFELMGKATRQARADTLAATTENQAVFSRIYVYADEVT